MSTPNSKSPVQISCFEYTSVEKAIEYAPEELFKAHYLRPARDSKQMFEEFKLAFNSGDKERIELFRNFLKSLSILGFGLRFCTVLYSEFPSEGKPGIDHEITMVLDFGQSNIENTIYDFERFVEKNLDILQGEIFGVPECPSEIHLAGVLSGRIIINEIF